MDDKIENLRQLQKKALFVIFGSLLLAIAISFLIYVIVGFRALAFIMAIVIFVPILASIPSRKRFKQAFKDVFVESTLKNIFTDLVYLYDREMPYQYISSTNMINMGNKYSSNDFIQATYKDVDFCQADVLIQEEEVYTDSDGKRQERTTTLFKGRWMIFEFNKQFKNDLQVRSKWFSHTMTSNSYKRVKLESELFNKTFKTYAESELEAFYILTPAMMERLMKLSQQIKGKLLFCFVDNKLHIGINNSKDSFEHNVFKRINVEKIRSEVGKDIKLITDFVDVLKLDNDLFKPADGVKKTLKVSRSRLDKITGKSKDAAIASLKINGVPIIDNNGVSLSKARRGTQVETIDINDITRKDEE